MLRIVENKLAMNAATKCGSRTVLAYAFLLKDPNAIEQNPEWFSPRGEYKYTLPLEKKIYISRQSITELNYPVLAAIVRDPIGRFLSSYANRMSFYVGSEPHSVQEFMDMYDDIKHIIPRYDTMDYSNKMSSYGDVKFHIAPLSKRYGTNPKFFTHIFNIRQMEDVKTLIEDVSKKKLPDLKLNETFSTEKPILTESQKQWILEKFKKDIELYGKWM